MIVFIFGWVQEHLIVHNTEGFVWLSGVDVLLNAVIQLIVFYAHSHCGWYVGRIVLFGVTFT